MPKHSHQISIAHTRVPAFGTDSAGRHQSRSAAEETASLVQIQSCPNQPGAGCPDIPEQRPRGHLSPLPPAAVHTLQRRPRLFRYRGSPCMIVVDGLGPQLVDDGLLQIANGWSVVPPLTRTGQKRRLPVMSRRNPAVAVGGADNDAGARMVLDGDAVGLPVLVIGAGDKGFDGFYVHLASCPPARPISRQPVSLKLLGSGLVASYRRWSGCRRTTCRPGLANRVDLPMPCGPFSTSTESNFTRRG